MILPIIIMPERHWDALAKEAISKTLPALAAQGYNTLCFESPSDECEEDLISGVQSTINFSQDRYSEANQLLQQRNIFIPNLAEMNYSELRQLLLYYVSSRHSTEMAIWFKELPGHVQKMKMIELAKSMNMSVQGVDLVKAELAPLRTIEAQSNLQIKIAAIEMLESKRISSFKRNLLDLQKRGRGIIFIVGQVHYEGLAEAFSTDHCLSEIIFAHPYAPKCLDTSQDDCLLPSTSYSTQLTMIDKKIEHPNDIDVFSTLVVQAVQSKVDEYEYIEPTIISKMLSVKTGLLFDAYVRPSMHVDAYYPITVEEDVSATKSELDKKGITSYITFFKGVRSYCIPCLNSPEVSDVVKTLGT